MHFNRLASGEFNNNNYIQINPLNAAHISPQRHEIAPNRNFFGLDPIIKLSNETQKIGGDK